MVYVGNSGIPRQRDHNILDLTVIDQEVQHLIDQKLNIYRMSLYDTTPLTASPGVYECVQRFFDQCSLKGFNPKLIIDPYHFAAGHPTMTMAEWASSTSKCLSIISHFSNYQDKFMIEPCNECQYVTGSSLDAEAKKFVIAVRNAGYTCEINVNANWNTGQVAIMKNAADADPLNKFWTGHHVYLDKIDGISQYNFNYAEAIAMMEQGLNAGLKMINTEIGANSAGNGSFTVNNVTAITDFMQWCADNGIGNCLWTMPNDWDWDFTQGYITYPEFAFPKIVQPVPVTLPYHNPLATLDEFSVINGTWSIG